jgi:hypothetical protein
MVTSSLAIALVLVTAGCGPKIRFSDSVDGHFDLLFTHPYDDELNSPYVAGAQFRIYAYDATEDNDLEGWTIVSTDPSVLEVTTSATTSKTATTPRPTSSRPTPSRWHRAPWSSRFTTTRASSCARPRSR